MALTTCPPVLALDEPSCGLGVTTKRFVHDAILRVLNAETTLLLTTHDMDEVECLVDNCCLMELGEVLVKGSVSKLRQSCNQQYELSIQANKQVVDEIAAKLGSQQYGPAIAKYNDLTLTWVI